MRPCPLVDAGGARRRVRRGAEPASGHPILEGDAWGAAKQRVLDDRRIGAIEEDSGRLAVAFAQDRDVVRRLRVRSDARELERPGVGDRDERLVHPPAPGHADVHRIVRRDGIEVVAGGEAPFRELVGAADVAELRSAQRHEHRPLARRGALDSEAHSFDDVLHRVAPREREAAAGLQPFAVHVGVRIVEAGADRRAFEVDRPRRVTAAGKHIGGSAQRGDGARGDADRLRSPGCRVESEYVTVVKDEVVLAHDRRP